jgi:hypothetical protein
MSVIDTSLAAHEGLVADALIQEATGASINRVRGHCGGSVALTGRALLSLEAQGRARFDCGRWYPVPAVARVEPEHGFTGEGEVAAAGRVRKKQWIA